MFSLWRSAVVSVSAVAFVRAVAGVLDVAGVLAFASIPDDPAVLSSGCPYIYVRRTPTTRDGRIRYSTCTVYSTLCNAQTY
jgi:hypothetical protein